MGPVLKYTEFPFQQTRLASSYNLNMLDFELATKTTGSRFVFVKDNTL